MSEDFIPIPVASALTGNVTGTSLPTGAGSSTTPGSSRRLNNEGNPVQAKSSKGALMVFLVFIANFLVFGFFKSLGMLTKILNKEFDATMNVYILMCITYSLNCGAGPLSCYLTRRYSARSVALVGTSMVTSGLILSWFAESLKFLYFSLGVLCGIGSGLTYPTGVILVSNYFTGTKNAAIANALVVSGSPIGGMIMPFVLSFLSERYTTRGAFLIVGGLMMHAILCVRAFRQPPSLKFADLNSSCNHSHPTTLEKTCTSPNKDEEAKELKISQEDDNNNIHEKEIHSCSTGILSSAGSKYKEEVVIFGQSASVQTVRRKPMPPHMALPLPEIANEDEAIGASDSVHGLTYRKRGRTNILNASTDTVVLKEIVGLNNSWSRPHCGRLTGTGSDPYMLALDPSCIILCPSKTDVIVKQTCLQLHESVGSVADGDAPPDIGDLENPAPNESTGNQETARKCAQLPSPLKNPIFLTLLFSNTSTAISTANIYLMLSQLVNEPANGYTSSSLLYLLISSADLTGRLTGACLCDKKIVAPQFIYAFGLVSAGIFSSLLATLSSFVELCVGVFAYGFSSGLHIGIYGLLLTNIVGIEKIHVGYGMSMFINGTVQCIAILLSGSMVAKNSSCFTWLAPVFGGILGTGGIIWISGMLLCRAKQEKDIIGKPDIPQSSADCFEGEDVVNNNCDDITKTENECET